MYKVKVRSNDKFYYNKGIFVGYFTLLKKDQRLVLTDTPTCQTEAGLVQVPDWLLSGRGAR